MPSGRTHDRITLWSLPIVVGLTFWQTRSSNLTLLVAGGFLFGGLMFGPDLDIYSRQYQRWGIFRWIWLPYRKMLRHRSIFSHGFLVGTTLRVLYLVSAIAFFAVVMMAVVNTMLNLKLSGTGLTESLRMSMTRYSSAWISLFVGLEAGAMSHSVSDWTGSAYKRFQKQGVAGLLPRAKMKKRKARQKSKVKNSKSKK